MSNQQGERKCVTLTSLLRLDVSLGASEYKRVFGFLFAKPGSDFSCNVLPKELTHPAGPQLQGTHAEAGKVQSYFQSSGELHRGVPLSGRGARQGVCCPRASERLSKNWTLS